MSLNQLVLCGRLTRDAELRGNGKNICASSTLAVNRDVKYEGKPEADFIPFVIFGEKRAETFAKYTRKGSRVNLRGRLESGSYDGQNGGKVYTYTLNVESFDFLDSSSQNEQATGQQSASRGQYAQSQAASPQFAQSQYTQASGGQVQQQASAPLPQQPQFDSQAGQSQGGFDAFPDFPADDKLPWEQ